MKLIKKIEASELPNDIRECILQTASLELPRDHDCFIYEICLFIGFDEEDSLDIEEKIKDIYSEEYIFNKRTVDDYLIKTFNCEKFEEVLISLNDEDLDLYIELNEWLR